MDTTRPFPNLTVVTHPLVKHKLTIMRDRQTPTKIFKELVDEIAMLMAYEATADLPLAPVDVQTPLEQAVGWQLSGKKLTLVPILRAGLGMVEGILRLVPTARVGHSGLYRDHDTLEPVDYYFKVPADASERDFFLLDPMLATGGSAVSAISSLKRTPSLPDVPTFDELGLKGYQSIGWYGVIAPAGTPPDIIRKLNAAFTETLKEPEVMERIRSVGAEPSPMTPEQFGAFIRNETAKWADVIKKAGIKPSN